jgi:urease accessory protein UreF
MKLKRIKRINHWKAITDGIVADYKRLDNACYAAMNAGAMDANGPLYQTIWRAFQGMLDRIDVDGWIDWFIHDNDCGKRQLEAKGYWSHGKRPIKTTRHLARLIVESEEHPTPDSNSTAD